MLAVAPGASETTSMRFFAGAKEWETIVAYENDPTWYMKLFGYARQARCRRRPGLRRTRSTGAGSSSSTKPIFFVLHLSCTMC